MRFLGRFVARAAFNIIGILAAAYFLRDIGFIFEGDFTALVIAAAALTLINTFVLPVVKLVLGPLIVITLGLILIVINALSLYILDIIIEPLRIEGIWPLLAATLIIGAINFLLNNFGKWGYRD